MIILLHNPLGRISRASAYHLPLGNGAVGRIRTDEGKADGLQDRSNQPLWDYSIFYSLLSEKC